MAPASFRGAARRPAMLLPMINPQRVPKAYPSRLAVNAAGGGRRALAMEVRQISEAREAPARFLVAICRSAPFPRQKLLPRAEALPNCLECRACTKKANMVLA